MATVFIAHGLNVGPGDNWYPALARTLAESGHTTIIPTLPDAASPRADAWLDALDAQIREIDPARVVLVGHSLGGNSILRLLERFDPTRAGAFAGVVLVVTPAYGVGYAALDPFFEPAFDWARIRRSAAKFQVLATADDPVNQPDPFDHVKRFVTGLNASALIVPDGGHFPSTGDECRELPDVARMVLSCLER